MSLDFELASKGALTLRAYSAKKSLWLLLALLVIGGLIGSLLGSAFGEYLPILRQGFPTIGLAPTALDLVVIKLTFGLQMSLNVAGIVGFLVALFVYFRL